MDIASLIAFRIAFGLILYWEVLRYIGYGWIARYYIEPLHHFTYYGFSWIHPWPGEGMTLHFYALGLLAGFIAVGFLYRISATLFFLGFTYVFLLDESQYLNHFYLVSLVSFLLIFLPLHRSFSIDAVLHPSIRAQTAPRWCLAVLRFQIALPYLYGGIAKLNADWLRGEPLSTWIADETAFPLIGSLFMEKWMGLLLSYGGITLDFLIVPLLLLKRTRPLGFALAVLFNLFNAELFSIGIFPWLMIAGTTLFFDPSWPRRILQRLEISCAQFALDRTSAQFQSNPRTIALLTLYVALQLLLPLRHFLYPGNVHWTEEGHRFSWHMKLRSKDANAAFTVRDPVSGRVWEEHPRAYLTAKQASVMASRPDMILQLAHIIAADARKNGIEHPEVRAQVQASLNGRPAAPLIDPTVNLAVVKRSLLPAPWILPLP